MDHQIVIYDGNVFKFPNSIPRKRSIKDIYDKILISFVSIGAGTVLCNINKLEFLFNSTIHSYVLVCVLELLNRISAFREEKSHLTSRYENDCYVLLRKLFSFNTKTVCCTVVVVMCVLHRYLNNQDSILEFINLTGLLPWILSFAGVKFLTDILQLDECTVKTAKIIDRIHGLDYGSAMAINFFYGYLNFMLPASGESRKSLEENIEDYAAAQGVTFASKKLYIFLPVSGNCPRNVADYSRGLLIRAGKLESKEIDRSGVKDRVYHCTVYKIDRNYNSKKKMKTIHVCCEFGSPLNTFYEVRQHNHSVTKFYEEHKYEIVTNFYMTLQKLLKEKNFMNMCELIYFQDKDEQGQIMYLDRLDIGELLLRVINLLPTS